MAGCATGPLREWNGCACLGERWRRSVNSPRKRRGRGEQRSFCFRCASRPLGCSGFADVSEARLAHAVVFDLFSEHGERADPEAVVAIEETVDDELLLGLAVAGDLDDLVVFAFIVAVASGAKF